MEYREEEKKKAEEAASNMANTGENTTTPIETINAK
jgi:hypothetical protein